MIFELTVQRGGNAERTFAPLVDGTNGERPLGFRVQDVRHLRGMRLVLCTIGH